MNQDIYLVGASWLQLDDSSDLQLDEAVFECASAAIKDAGVRRGDIGLSITSSLDLYDARSISNALTAPAAGGYLNEELRVEGDVGSALMLAMASLVGGQTEMAIVVGLNAPEIGTTSEPALRRLREKISSYTFDSHIDRPVGMTSNTTLGLQAAQFAGQPDVWRAVTEQTARDVNRGAAAGWGLRQSVTADAVAAAPVVVSPLTEPMLPAHSAAIGAMVVAIGVTGLRSPHPIARVRGWGAANGPGTQDPSWLFEPAAAAGAAASAAFRTANVSGGEAAVLAEVTDLSPTVTPSLIDALGIGHLDTAVINASGGPRGNYPGIANGALRVTDAARAVAEQPRGSLAIAHSTDDLMGLVASSNTVFVLESL